MTSITQPASSILIVGAVHVDEVAHSTVPLVMKASNRIQWQHTLGGVATNVARAAHHSLAGASAVSLIGTVGDDPRGRQIQQILEASGINASLSVNPQYNTGRYTVIIDNDGELCVGLSDVAIAEQLTCGHVHQATHWPTTQAVLIDANLTQSCIEDIIDQTSPDSIPTAAVAVSPAKALRLLPIATKLDLLFCNRREAAALTRLPNESNPIEKLAEGLLETGFKQFILTDGSEPALLQLHDERLCVPVPAISLAQNVNGAGDALAGATFAQWTQGLSLRNALTEHGLRMAANVVIGKHTAPAL